MLRLRCGEGWMLLTSHSHDALDQILLVTGDQFELRQRDGETQENVLFLRQLLQLGHTDAHKIYEHTKYIHTHAIYMSACLCLSVCLSVCLQSSSVLFRADREGEGLP